MDVLFICQDPGEILGMGPVTEGATPQSVFTWLTLPSRTHSAWGGGTGTPAIYIPSVVLNDSETEG